MFFGARLIPLEKKTGGIRPIAVGSILRRLCSKLVICTASDRIMKYLQPHQIGFHTKNGAEVGVHIARDYISVPSQKYVLKIDFSNAFNSVSRQEIFNQIEKVCPETIPYVSSAYLNESLLMLNDGSTIESSEGVQQGDPLGPLLFSLAIHPVVLQLKSRLNVWYLDDGLLGSQDVAELFHDYILLKDEAAKIGLHINAKKCEIVHNDSEEVAEFLKMGVTQTKLNDFQFLGAGIEPECVTAVLNDKLESLKGVHKRLHLLPAQQATFLLRACFGLPRFMYILLVLLPIQSKW